MVLAACKTCVDHGLTSRCCMSYESIVAVRHDNKLALNRMFHKRQWWEEIPFSMHGTESIMNTTVNLNRNLVLSHIQGCGTAIWIMRSSSHKRWSQQRSGASPTVVPVNAVIIVVYWYTFLASIYDWFKRNQTTVIDGIMTVPEWCSFKITSPVHEQANLKVEAGLIIVKQSLTWIPSAQFLTGIPPWPRISIVARWNTPEPLAQGRRGSCRRS